MGPLEEKNSGLGDSMATSQSVCLLSSLKTLDLPDPVSPSQPTDTDLPSRVASASSVRFTRRGRTKMDREVPWKGPSAGLPARSELSRPRLCFPRLQPGRLDPSFEGKTQKEQILHTHPWT